MAHHFGEVLERKELVLAGSDMTTQQWHLTTYILSMIPTKIDDLSQDYALPMWKDDFIVGAGFGSIKAKYRLNSIFKGLLDRAVFSIPYWDTKRHKRVIKQVPVFNAIINKFKDKELTFLINKELLPYVCNMRTTYTHMDQGVLQSLNSKYAIKLYQWLNMYAQQFIYYTQNGGRTAEFVDGRRHPNLPADTLREMMGKDTGKVYEGTVFNTFRDCGCSTEQLLGRPLAELNAKAPFTVTYKANKYCGVIQSFDFTITIDEMPKLNKQVNKVTKVEDTPVKKPITVTVADLPTGMNVGANVPDTQVQGVQANGFHPDTDTLIKQAKQSRYTKLLMRADFDAIGLDKKDLDNDKLMETLSRKVYPWYDVLRHDGSIKAVANHISYLKEHSHLKGQGITSFVNYLATSVQTWIQSRHERYQDNYEYESMGRVPESMPEFAPVPTELSQHGTIDSTIAEQQLGDAMAEYRASLANLKTPKNTPTLV